METILPGHYVRFARSKTRPIWKVLELSDDGKRAKLEATKDGRIRLADVDKLKISDLSYSWGDENLVTDVDLFLEQSKESSDAWTATKEHDLIVDTTDALPHQKVDLVTIYDTLKSTPVPITLEKDAGKTKPPVYAKGDLVVLKRLSNMAVPVFKVIEHTADSFVPTVTLEGIGNGGTYCFSADSVRPLSEANAENGGWHTLEDIKEYISLAAAIPSIKDFITDLVTGDGDCEKEEPTPVTEDTLTEDAGMFKVGDLITFKNMSSFTVPVYEVTSPASRNGKHYVSVKGLTGRMQHCFPAWRMRLIEEANDGKWGQWSAEKIVEYIAAAMEDIPEVKEQVTKLVVSESDKEEHAINFAELGVEKIKGDVIFTGEDDTVLIRDSYTDALYHLADIELPKMGKRKVALPIYKAKN